MGPWLSRLHLSRDPGVRGGPSSSPQLWGQLSQGSGCGGEAKMGGVSRDWEGRQQRGRLAEGGKDQQRERNWEREGEKVKRRIPERRKLQKWRATERKRKRLSVRERETGLGREGESERARERGVGGET